MSPNDASGGSEIIYRELVGVDHPDRIRRARIEVLGDPRQRDVDEGGVETGKRDSDHQGQDRPVPLRDRHTVFGVIHVVMSPRQYQGAENGAES
jgi:hypothetical protein